MCIQKLLQKGDMEKVQGGLLFNIIRNIMESKYGHGFCGIIKC